MADSTISAASHSDMATLSWFDNGSARRINTDVVLVEALRTQYPNLDLVVTPVNLVAYASAGFAEAVPLEDPVKDPVYGPGLRWRVFLPPTNRLHGRPGGMAERLIFGKFMYKWKGQEAIMYIADGRDGGESWPAIVNTYVLTNATHKVDDLIKEATLWATELHNEVWVFDGGYWQKSAELWNSIQNATWESVILDEGMKKALISDVETFYDAQQTYADLKVPWKRGIIYYGPPGNGKTISIKAMMNSLYKRGVDGDKRMSVPTLYVRTLSSYAGPEYSLQQIFRKARDEAPCYLVFEDLDSIVRDEVRSYFLNEVDGLRANDGILMVGSTNHLDRLDPGISKRPSRFDRKYYFPNPDYPQRVQYAHFWQNKLKSNTQIDFPDRLCEKVAEITDKFSFAYMQEAFVATLLAIAGRGGKDMIEADRESERWVGPFDPMTEINHLSFIKRMHSEGSEPDVEKLELWIEIQKQVKILREEMEEGAEAEVQAEKPKQFILPSRPADNRAENPTKYRDELDGILHGRRERSSDWEFMLPQRH